MHLKEPRILVYIMARRTVDEVILVVFHVKNGQSFFKNKIQPAVFAFVSGSITGSKRNMGQIAFVLGCFK
jgi:hypothetical protein